MSDTIREDYQLPSLGKIYSTQFDPNIRLRSMTVEDEMKRLSPTKYPYKMMSEIIESCLIEKLPISVYDLCLGDYIYLLHKLRITTYGPEYVMSYVCPICGNVETVTVNLDEITVNKYDKNFKNLTTVKLPKTDHTVTLRLQTPRDLDDISNKAEEMKEQFPEMKGDPIYLLTLQSFIKEVDGKPVDPIMIKETLKKLPMMDTNILSQSATKLNNSIGLESTIKTTCSKCNNNVIIPFRFTGEFFRPQVY